ncbi:DUF2459 domain-containing protein [Geomesophilobacter sediminis]|uniref:DUF2459 domain-containing protein n=1 Tax=Geomesophilobacter sediminis TaxID=2798584 RepID=A0A8J7LYQ4_9BACT|nr:DUF2459 domain-containing protein [Geomesophilobacter sediminis]MBJ6725257.1 DUF2459 domain-containing protein [Geomesophilobacter sediminis]
MENPRPTEAPRGFPEGTLPEPWRALLVVVIAVMLAGCATDQGWRYLPPTRAQERSIFVVGHGWHTGVVLSKEDLGPELSFINDYLHEGRYYEFGWGEAEFYQAQKVTPSIFLKAVFWRNPSVMHVVSVPGRPEQFFTGADVVALTLSETGLRHLKENLRASFKFDRVGLPHALKKGLYGESRFFQAEGQYVITDTCNTWTAKMLDSGGVPMNTVFTVRAVSVMRQVKKAQREYPGMRPVGQAVPALQ